jgi:hypothetical protein
MGKGTAAAWRVRLVAGFERRQAETWRGHQKRLKYQTERLRMARAALRLGVGADGGNKPDDARGRLRRETTVQPEPATLAALRAAFEREGIVFQDDDGVKHISWQASFRPKPEEVALNTLLDRYARFRIFKQETPETTAN